jgi:hypothetical protein
MTGHDWKPLEKRMEKWLLLALVAMGYGPVSSGELTWDFESGIPAEYFTTANWGARDASFDYGPRGAAGTGSRWCGAPVQDLPEYPGLLVASLTTTEIDLTELQFASLYISWVQWADFEGVATNFDGVHLLISSNGGTSWAVVDSPPAGGIQPAYDAKIVEGGGTPLSGKWAYCYDTVSTDSAAEIPIYRFIGRGKPMQTAGGGSPEWRAVMTGDLIALGYVAPSDKIQLRWLFGADPLAGGQGYFIDDLRVADSAPDCLIPPGLRVDTLTDTPDTLSDYRVAAEIQRVCADVDEGSVILHYWSDIQADTVDVAMAGEGGGAFAASIPAQPNDTDVWYWVSVADVVGNQTRSVTRTFEVTDAITLVLDDGQPFYIDPTFYAAGDGLAARFRAPASPDSSYLLYKLEAYLSRQGRFDVGVWRAGGEEEAPDERVFTSGSITNEIDNGWWSYAFADTSLAFSAAAPIYVGFTLVTGDSLDNPAIAYDELLDDPAAKWILEDNTWHIDQAGQSGELMLRLKVKARGGTGVAGETHQGALPTAFAVHGNYPNPFNPWTVIRYDLAAGTGPLDVRVTVYDLAGRAVATLVDGPQLPGRHSVAWQGRSDGGMPVPSGVYFYRVEAGNQATTRKMVLVK